MFHELQILIFVWVFGAGRSTQSSVKCERSSSNLSMSESEHFSTEARLISDLLDGYKLKIRPEGKTTTRTTVSVSMTLLQIISLSEKAERLTTSLFMSYTWYDSRLRWTLDDYGGIKLIRIRADNIWTPDIIVTNTMDGDMQQAVLVNVLVYNTGVVEWLPPSIFKTTCTVKVEKFPFDRQVCSLVFASAGYDSSQMTFRLARNENNSADIRQIQIDENAFVPNGEWDLLKRPAEVEAPVSADVPATITFTIHIKRKPQFYILNMLLPCVLLTVLSCFTFYLPVVAGEKIGMGIALLLGDTVFIFLFAQRMPSTSFSVPLLTAYLLYVMVLLSFCVLCSVLVYNMHYRSNTTHVIPAWLKHFMCDFLQRVVGLGQPGSERICASFGNTSMTTFPVQRRRKAMESGRDCYPVLSEQMFFEQSSRFGIDATQHRQAGDCSSSSSLPRVLASPPAFSASISCCELIRNYLEKEQRQQMSKDDWAQMAVILDRALMWFYLSFFALGSVAFYFAIVVVQ